MLLTLALLAGGLAVFASTQASERRRHGAPKLSDRRLAWRRAIGTILLTLALIASVADLGVGFGLVYWTLALGGVGLTLAIGQGIVADRAGLHRGRHRRGRA